MSSDVLGVLLAAGVVTKSQVKAATALAGGKPGRPADSKRVKAMHEQGVYLSVVRGLTKAQRLQVKKIRQEKGFQEAIEAAKGMTSR